MDACLVGGRSTRGVFLVLLSTLAVGALSPATASAAILTPTPFPLPGSTFQGADGNQDDAAPFVDWQSLQAQGRVQHNPDSQTLDTAFTAGSKEGEPGNWDLTAEPGGVNPSRDNILDAWSIVDQVGANTFLYLGFARQEEGGSTFLAFELNQDERLWDNGLARIPCRRTADVLVAYEPHGTTIGVLLQRWITEQTDPMTGCATTGQIETVESFSVDLAQGAMNQASIVNRLPSRAAPGTLEAGEFGETALNLGQLLARAFNDQCLAFRSIWMHSRSGNSSSANMQDYVTPRRLSVRTCAASGTKFFDLNANGARDPGERGIPRFVIFADYNDDGRRQADEPFTITDRRGRYVLYDIRPPDGTYTLRESLVTRASGTSWICSYPNSGTPGGFGGRPGDFPCGWGPIDAATTPNAEGRNFGNWFPARLVVEKELEPAGDPGRFDLLVNGEIVLAAAGDGASATVSLPPGVYDLSEAPATGTDAAAYRSTVECKVATQRRRLRSGPVHEDLALRAGDLAVCTFRNIRAGAPAIAIDKTGPAVSERGDTLRYTLFVTNTGDLPFPAASVEVVDTMCDDPPQLAGTSGASGPDATPASLDPGDTWTYRCSRQTAPAGEDCKVGVVPNTATVTGVAGGVTVGDQSSIATILTCPNKPTPPQPEPPGPDPPGPDPPGPVVPPGPRPPPAGGSGTAGIRAPGPCITRLPRVHLVGTRVARLRVIVDGRPVRRIALRPLQGRAALPPLRLAPGQHRVTIRVAFQLGSGTAPLVLRRSIKICVSSPPGLTG